MKNIVYLITRNDGKQYVGITCQFNKRISAHKKTERFSIGIKDVKILHKCETYEEAEKLEPFYIQKYDTFYNGLNESINGKGNHLAPKFTTRGYKFTEEQKENMRKNHWSKRMKNTWTKPGQYSEETRLNWSKKRKGKYWGKTRKIPKEMALEIIHNYEKDLIEFDNEFIQTLVKKTDKENVGKVTIEELKSPNGLYLNKEFLYCCYYAPLFNVSRTAIRGLLRKGIAEDANQI